MRLLAWVRASQAILFEASIAPACVGTAAALAVGTAFVPLSFLLILVSLLGIQAGANLLKGYHEARDRSGSPSSPGSWIAFDSGAAVGLARDPRNVLRVAWAFLILGIVAGLALVALTRSLLLLAFGVAGFVLAWSYSSPPLKLSYRGVGELSTFLAFGPIMTVGSTVAFDPAGWRGSLLASLILGFLAASISFSRYFPNEAEDRAKGKRTPVTILGRRPAAAFLLGLVWAAIGVAFLWWILDGRFVWALVFVPPALGAIVALPRGLAGRLSGAWTIGLTVLAHALAGLGLVLAFLL
ncbi:MAG TPA: prenyltransferase [Thermoplasmata archaeon]|nr:prenyltransferase [Thermoplasmata archaeon]